MRSAKKIKRPARRIQNFGVHLEDQRNITNRLRQTIQINPNMSVSEFVNRSKFKAAENKKIIDAIKQNFGDLSIKELKMSQLNYFFGMYTKDAKIRNEIIRKIQKDPLRLSFRIIRQRINLVNKCKDNSG